MDDSSDAGSDFEVQLKSMKRRKQAVSVPGLLSPKRLRRKAAAQPTSSPDCSPNSTPPGRSPKPQRSLGTSRQASAGPVRRRDQGISAGDIYEAIRSGKSAVVTVVDEWLDSYKQEREAGLLVLINFIVQCCGCKGVVSREMFDNLQNAEIISTLTKEFDEDSVNYPLYSLGSQWKHFRAGLCEFVRVLVRSCQNSLLYDEYLFSSLLALLTGLSDSQVRAFRHTSTLLAMKLMTGVVEVALIVYGQLQTSQRRYNIENSKETQDRANDKLEELQGIVNELRERREELSSLINSTLRGVFVHRYRDCVAEIRAVCIKEMGVWLREDPEYFLHDGHLKYLGWTLYDKQGSVRLQCVRALQGLYQEKDFIGRLELFTGRFKERMLGMVLDKDPDVAVEVVHLLLLIQQRTDDILREDDCGHVYPLVFTSHRGLASAAGAFFYNKLKTMMVSDDQEMDAGGRKVAFFNILISFYTQSEFHEHGAYLVDSLWDVAGSELRDWETMTSLLLQETVEGQGLTYEEEGTLIELMTCAIRRAAEANPPVGRAHGKKILSMKDKKTQAQDRRRITAHFIPLLPQLLAKYSADVEKVSLLLKTPLYFDLETYSSAGRLEKYLELLLSQVCSIVEKHTEAGVLEACARLSCALCSDRYTFSARAHLAFSRLLDGLAECFSTYFTEVLQGTADEDDAYSASTALKRIAAFSSAMDLTSWQLFDPCYQLVKSGVESRNLDKEIMVPALTCAAFHLLWAKLTLTNSTTTEAEMKRVNKEVRSFCSVSHRCLSLGQAEIRDQAFELLCDLLLIYSVGSVRSQPALHTLACPPSDSLRSEMAAFLLDYIFTDPEEAELHGEQEEEEEVVKITCLQRKRNQLAGYCKLVIYGVLDLRAATDVFKHYSKFYKDFGDIIKETLSKSRFISPVQSAKTVCLSLQQLFSEMMSEERSSQDLGEIRDLAKRLAMSFGIDLHRVRKPLVALHTDGIHFAFREPEEGQLPNPNLAFLEILSEFSFKLHRQDRSQLSVFLQAQCPSAALSWPSVRMYRRSLETVSSSKTREEEGAVGRSVTLSPPSTPIAKRRRTTAQGSASSGKAAAAWLDSSIHSRLPTPTFTSTVQRRQSAALATVRPGATASDKGSVLSEPESEEDFSYSSQMYKVKPNRQRQPSPSPSLASDQPGLDSHLTL
ncbi:cohesin subunit SA-1 [Polymixia lowei]